jgi:hypothetical protein
MKTGPRCAASSQAGTQWKTTENSVQGHFRAAKGATDYNLKVIEIARTKTNAAFEHVQELLGVSASNSIR